MRTKNKLLLSYLAIASIAYPLCSYGQGWEWQNPLPTGNRFNCMEFTDSLNGWFGSSAGTILHTSDGGDSWDILYTGIDGNHYTSIDFLDENTGWAVGNESGGPSYIIHTTNGGEDWTVQRTDPIDNFIKITFRNKNYGWVGTDGGEIYYTTNGGTNWELGWTGRGNVMSIVFHDSLYGWAEGQGGMPLLHTVDGGKIWTEDTTGIVGTRVFFTDSLHGWITSWERLIRTTDGGNTWLYDLPDIIMGEDYQLLTDVFFVDTLTGWVTVWEEGIYRTNDGGWTWEKISDEMPYIINGAYYFFTRDSGWIDFSKTWDGGKTLHHKKVGFTFEHFLDVDFITENTGWVAGHSGLIAKTTDSGQTWCEQESNTGVKLSKIFAINEQIVWIIGGSLVLHTEDGGDSWNFKDIPADTYPTPKAVHFLDTQTGWMVGGNNIIGGWILYTEDGGNTWVKRTSDTLPALLDVEFVNENIGWAMALKTLINTTDGGRSWNIQLDNPPYSILSISFANERMGWLCGSDTYIVHTDNGGMTWQVQSKDEGIYAQDILFIDENNGWTCGIIGKVFHTQDGGETWQKEYTGTTESLYGIDFIDEETGWIVGWNGAILRTPSNGSSDVDDNSANEYGLDSFKLYPNYPNPFNAHTVIPYYLEHYGLVQLTIYNLLGREVITLVDEVQSPGLHEISWNGKDWKGGDVPSGMYFYQIRTREGFEGTGKMMMVK